MIPKHLFEPYKGTNSREAPANLKPIGTGPYRFVDFAPGDFLIDSAEPAQRHVAEYVISEPLDPHALEAAGPEPPGDV